MKQKTVPVKQLAEDVIRDIRRATRRCFLAEEKIRIIRDSLRGVNFHLEMTRLASYFH